MFNRNHLQALRLMRYPEVPAAWPNRQVRRALRYGMHRLPAEWRAFLATRQEMRKAILGLA